MKAGFIVLTSTLGIHEIEMLLYSNIISENHQNCNLWCNNHTWKSY